MRNRLPARASVCGVLACWASFRSQEKGNSVPAPLIVGVSHDGGSTWQTRQITAAANNGQRNPLDGCSIRTDSHGRAYVFGVGTLSSSGHQAFEFVSQSDRRPCHPSGRVRSRPGLGRHRRRRGRPGGSRSGPERRHRQRRPDRRRRHEPDRPELRQRLDRHAARVLRGVHEPRRELVYASSDETAGDRGFYSAPAISPNGQDVYEVYSAFTTPFRPTTAPLRSLVGVVEHADAPGATGATGSFTEIYRGTPDDPRGSSANVLDSEFLGDYVYAAATNDYGAAERIAIGPAV